MAVRIRLTRVGAKKQPSYRVVVADSRSARDSRSIETLGHYNPRTDPVELNIDADKAKAWLAKGALPSDTVARLFRNVGVLSAASAPTYPKVEKAAKPASTKVDAPAKASTPQPAASPETAEPAETAETAESTEIADSAETAESATTADAGESEEGAESDDEEASK